jgi:hypothetical protein
VHHLLCFFKSTLTVPKIKDLVNSPATKYEHIFDTITNANANANARENTYVNEYSYTDIDLLPTNANETTNPPKINTTNAMKDELKHFLKKQLNNN